MARFKNAANTAKGTPRFWDVQVSPIAGPDGRPSHILSISRDITEEWQLRELDRLALEKQCFLTAELTHRVKNTLATVMAIANQTFREQAFKDAREIFNYRLQSLGAAYNVLTQSSWDKGDIRSIIEGALVPYKTGPGTFKIEGPPLAVSPNQSLTLALAINELATNAMKYGALSTQDGRIDIFWRADPSLDGNAFRLEWRESNGPVVNAPTRTGFGSRLIKSMLAKDFGGTVELHFEPAGLNCILSSVMPGSDPTPNASN
jgi:two-component sensor histidine kinase